MTSSQVVLKLVLDAIDQPLELDAFEKRLKLQKRIYLTQLTGLDLGYRFSWYLHGPYCRELTSDAFRLQELARDGVRGVEGKTLNAIARRLASSATSIWCDAPAGMGDDDWLELLASLHYLKHISYWPSDQPRGFDAVFEALVDSKPRFKARRDDAQRAWQRLEKVGLTDQKVLCGSEPNQGSRAIG